MTSDGSSLVQPHFVSLRSGGGRGPTLIFLEDTTLIAERVQQSKLAALGRLSASIAHEIRNPVGAMSHAAQLLAEAPQLSAAGTAPDRHHHQERRSRQLHHQQRAAAVAPRFDPAGTHRAERLAGGLPRANSARPRRWTSRMLYLTTPARGPGSARRSVASASAYVESVRERTEVRRATSIPMTRIEIRTGRIATSERPMLEVAGPRPGHRPERRRAHLRAVFHRPARAARAWVCSSPGSWPSAIGAVLMYEPRSGGGSIFRLVFADPQRWETQ